MIAIVRNLGFAAVIGFAGLAPCRADDGHAAHRSLLKSLQANAGDARANAATYQWARVNREVDRIVSAEKKLQKALASHNAVRPQLKKVAQAVSDLRSARLKRDADRAVKAAKELASLSADLLKEEGDPAPR